MLAALAPRFEVFHLVDHSYSQLLHGLPAGRTLVTCHDLDTFRSVLQPHDEPRPAPFRWMTQRILSGLRLAAHIACDSDEPAPRVKTPPAKVAVAAPSIEKARR